MLWYRSSAQKDRESLLHDDSLSVVDVDTTLRTTYFTALEVIPCAGDIVRSTDNSDTRCGVRHFSSSRLTLLVDSTDGIVALRVSYCVGSLARQYRCYPLVAVIDIVSYELRLCRYITEVVESQTIGVVRGVAHGKIPRVFRQLGRIRQPQGFDILTAWLHGDRMETGYSSVCRE